MSRYYKLDSRKVTFGEYWNIVHSPMVLIPWIAKLLNIPLKFSSGMPDFDSVRQLEVPEAEFSELARQKLQPLLDKCLAMGFSSPRFFTYENMRRDSRVSIMAMLHESGATVRLMHTRAARVQPPQEKMLVVLLSELSDGTYFFTSSQRKQFISQPKIVANRLIGAGPEQLLASHLRKLSEFQSVNPAKPVRSTEQLDELWDRYEKSSREFGMQRGIYVWMTPEEVAKESEGLAEVQAVTASSGSQNADVLLELHRLQNKKAGWGGIIALLLISLILFAVVGRQQWSWSYLVILLSVLFVHELGHYLAMRAFNYRNVRMFFIPFFGAAVSGENHNVSGWKKVIVSLMGPLPGIVLGIVLGGAGIVLHQPWLLKASFVALLLNGFNLLPVLPLDGGWVFHTLIFSRHPMLDAAFRVVASIGLVVLGSFTKSKILMYLGIPMIVSIPAAYRTSRLAAELKQRGFPPTPPEEQGIPAASADVIISEIKKSSTRPQSNKTIAQQTLQIFETINARPPGWPATLGLLFVHIASIAAAAIFAIAFLVVQRADLREILANASNLPKHALQCGPVPGWEGKQFAKDAGAANDLIVATFSKQTEAERNFQSVTNQLPDNCRLTQFGDTLLLSFPAGEDSTRKHWLHEFQAKTKDVFVDSTNYHAAFSLLCIAPDQESAATIAGELQNYMQTLPGWSLVPPWFADDTRPAAQKVRDELARQTYLTLQNSQFAYFTNAELKILQKNLTSAQKQGSRAEAEDLRAQIKTLTRKLSNEQIETVRSGIAGPIDSRVVELFVTLMDEPTATNRAAADAVRHDLAQHFGQIQAGSPGERLTAQFGDVSRSGLFIHVNWISFEHLDEGPVALTKWLCSKGCTGIKYEFQPGLGGLGGEGDE